MAKLLGKQKVNPTSTQYNRWLRALDPDYAKVDDRSFNQLLDFSIRFGSLINFFNLDDEVDGDWVDFFQSEPSMVLASIESISIGDIEKYFDQLQKQFHALPIQAGIDTLRDGIELITRLARRFDAWTVALNNAKEPASAVTVRDKLRNLIESNLSFHLQQLYLIFYKKKHNSVAPHNNKQQIREETKSDLLVDFKFPNFSNAWRLNLTLSDSSDLHQLKGIETNNIFDSLLPILNAFIDGLADLKNHVRFNIPNHEQHSHHRPQVALYMAFARLYRHAQKSANTFSARYARFYYQEVLRENKRRASSDHVYLNFTLEQEEEISSAPIPEGTLFSAGQDDNGYDKIYAADKSLQVSTASIAQLCMLNVQRGPLILNSTKNNPENNPLVDQRILTNQIVLDDKDQTDNAWPSFGGLPNDKTAVLGFAIASPYLSLSGGERNVQLQFQYTQKYYENILKPLLETLTHATGRSESDIFYKVLLNAFSLHASSESGWFNIENYSILFMDDCGNKDLVQIKDDIFINRAFQICFTLPESAPAIAPLVADENFYSDIHLTNTDQPVVNIYLSTQTMSIDALNGESIEIYPMSLLGKMTIDAVDIFTQVKNLNNLALQNTDGDIDPNAPFLIFGGTPVLGSYFQLSHQELFSKTPSNLSISLEWFNIPKNDTGFFGYYRYYDIGPNGTKEANLFNNTTFRGDISIVNPGSWNIGVDQSGALTYCEDVELFRTKLNPGEICCPRPPIDNKPLCSHTNFENLKVNTPVFENLARDEFPPYYNPSDSALRLTLSTPSYAFGDSLYAQNVLNSVIEAIPDTDDCRNQCLCDCRPMEDTILCLESILENCLSITEPNQRLHHIETKLVECESVLVTAFIQNLLRWLLDYEGGVESKKLADIRDACRDLLSQESATRLQNIKKCLDAIKTLDKTLEIISSSPEKENYKKNCEALYKLTLILYGAQQRVIQCPVGDGAAACEHACLVSALDKARIIYDASLTACMNTRMAPEQELKYPNEPYLPQAVSVQVDYHAACTLFDITGIRSAEPKSDFYHLLPFGGYRKLNRHATSPLLILPNYANSGNLYLGLSALVTPQILTLLFQINDACGVELPPVYWHILSDNHWEYLPPIDDISDSTHGLQNSGIVALSLPMISNTNNTLLDNKYSWLRASVVNQAQDFPHVQAIFPHALCTSRVMNEPPEQRVSTDFENTSVERKRSPTLTKSEWVLQAHTISSAVEDLPNISQINQPMPSFGGRAQETYSQFEVRMGERMRHKDRVIQTWDYERLVLEQFPDIWKVQALNAHDEYCNQMPGHVLVVVIAGPNCIDCSDPTTPTVPYDMLQSIRQTLQQRASPFVKLHVSNPVYVRVQVKVEADFYNTENSGKNIERLNSDLVQYLSPWFYQESCSARSDDYTSEANITSFILSRPYVRNIGSIQYFYEPRPEALRSDWYFVTSEKQHIVSMINHQTCPISASGCSY